MRNLLLAVLILFSTSAFASPEWRNKPIQCAEVTEVYQAYIWRYDLKPLFVGVSTIADSELQPIPTAIAFYLNDNGHWLFLELGDNDACVVSMGNGWDPNISEELLDKILFGKNNT